MWRRDRTSSADCLRIGRHAVERWAAVDGGLVLRDAYALSLEGPAQPSGLKEAIGALYPASSKSTAIRIQLVLESAWLPVMLLDTGAAMLRAGQIDALARHRFGQQFSDDEAVATWGLRIKHRAGRRQALVYGLAPQVKQVLVSGAKSAGLQWSALSPALSWGWEHLRLDKIWPRSAQSDAWLVWPEQDRSLIARVVANEVVGLNAGGPPVGTESMLLDMLEVEKLRVGAESTPALIAAAHWGSSRAERSNPSIRWLNMGPSDGMAVAPSRPTSVAGASA